MDIKIIIDKQSESRMNNAAENLQKYCEINNIKVHNKEMWVIFSNNYEFVKETVEKLPKNAAAINVTENLSEQHVINTLKYVADICYLKTDVNIIATRIISAYNKTRINSRSRI